MISIANDTARCAGTKCPSKLNCRRYTALATGSEHIWYAAFWARREAGASACDSIIPVNLESTFSAAGFRQTRDEALEVEIMGGFFA